MLYNVLGERSIIIARFDILPNLIINGVDSFYGIRPFFIIYAGQYSSV